MIATNAKEQQRANWHARHPEIAAKAKVVAAEAEPTEEKVPRTRIIKMRDVTFVFLLVCQKQGFLRALSSIGWLWVFRFANWSWKKALWLRAAYQYARWRMSPYERHSAPLMWKRIACESCDWRVMVDDVAYCDACICPKEPHASISRKNERTYPHCPKGKHPGSRVDPYAKMQPCVGCGGRRKHGNANMATKGTRGS